MEGRIFISYSRRDLDVVKPIKEELEANGFSCWMDLEGIESGSEEFTEHLANAIEQSRVLLFFLSVNSQKSRWSLNELRVARDDKKHVVLIRFNNDNMITKFRLEFGGADVIDWRQPEQKAKLLRDLRLWEDEATEPHSPTATQKPSTESVTKQTEGSLVTCPVCGKKNNPVDTFRCRECGRDNLCVRHQDEKTYLCCECTEMAHARDDSVKITTRQQIAPTIATETFHDYDTFVPYGQMSGKDTKRYLNGELLLGRYEVLATLGQGGTGYVYKCLDRLGRVEVAVKVLPLYWSRDSSVEENIRENFRLVSGLRHPGIVGLRTLEHDSPTGSYFLVMDLAPGITLREWAGAHRTRRYLQAKLKIIAEIAAILDYAHSQGVLHRDVKPENVAIDDDGGVHVFDFGIASQTPSADSQICQGEYPFSGTLSYMSPEQWRGQLQDATTDQYSLAVLSYELISGSLPFVSSDMASLMERVMSEPVASIQGVSDYVNSALARALAKNPRERFASCKDFADALEGKKVQKKTSFITKVVAGVAAVSAGFLLPLKKK